MPARVLAKRVNLQTRTVAVDVEDDFGVVNTHTLPLMADSCPHCGGALPSSTPGTPDITAAINLILSNTDAITANVAQKLAAAGIAVATKIG